MRALFLGRFQPFHNGHLAMLKKILKENESVIVIIGSAQFSNTKENPLSAGERIVMATKVLRELKAKEFYVIPIEDVGNNELWASKIEELAPKFDVVYTNNPLTERIFKERGYKVKIPGLVKREELSGTRLRELISKDGDWKKCVPKSVAAELIKIGAQERIKLIK